MKTIIKIKTWKCECGYRQDFEPTQENQDKHFNNDKGFPINNLLAGECPNCKLQGRVGEIVKEIDPDKKSTLIIMGEEDIDIEIEQIKERKSKGEDTIKDPDLSTKKKEDDYRTKRLKDINDAILRARMFEDN